MYNNVNVAPIMGANMPFHHENVAPIMGANMPFHHENVAPIMGANVPFHPENVAPIMDSTEFLKCHTAMLRLLPMDMVTLLVGAILLYSS